MQAIRNDCSVQRGAQFLNGNGTDAFFAAVECEGGTRGSSGISGGTRVRRMSAGAAANSGPLRKILGAMCDAAV